MMHHSVKLVRRGFPESIGEFEPGLSVLIADQIQCRMVVKQYTGYDKDMVYFSVS